MKVGGMAPAPQTRKQVEQATSRFRIGIVVFLVLGGLFGVLTMDGHAGALVAGVAGLGLFVYLTRLAGQQSHHPWNRGRV